MAYLFPYNQVLLNHLSGKAYTGQYAERVYQEIWKQFPQINPQTTVKFVDSYEIAWVDEASFVPAYAWQDRKGLRPRLWRLVGEMFGKSRWRHRGMLYDLDPTAPVPPAKRIPLKPYIWDMGLDRVWVAMAYLPAADTLCVYSRYSEQMEALWQTNIAPLPITTG